MQHKAKSVRTFIGAKDFSISRKFYAALGFTEYIIAPNFSYFQICNSLGFYMQDYYVKDWIDNSMVFVEVENADTYYTELSALELDKKFPGVRLVPVKVWDWGKECFLHDPSGILWHFGEFT